MKEKDYIIELLNQADRGLEVRAGADPLELASKARTICRRRQNRRQITVAACIILLITLVGFKTFTRPGPTKSTQAKQVADAKQVEDFTRQAQATLAQIRQLNARIKQDKRKNQLYRQYAQIVVESEPAFTSEDKAALKLMNFADQLQADDNTAKEAKKRTYDKVIQYFPNSQYAETAKQKLVALANTL